MAKIPFDEMVAKIRNLKWRQEAMDAYLVQQEILVTLTAALHRAGLVDGNQAAASVRQGIDELRGHDLISDYGCALAELFQGRVLDAVQACPARE